MVNPIGRRAHDILICVLCAASVAVAAAAGQMPRRTIYVTALDRDGKPVTGLTATDFKVKEDGRVREIQRVEPAVEPMQIALLLDDASPSLGPTRQAAGNFVERLQGKAMFALISTAATPQMRVRFTVDPRELYRGLQNFFPNRAPTTQFLDALVDVSRGFVRGRASRPVIVGIVAEGEELSEVRADVVMQTLQQSRAIFYYVGLGVPATSGTRPAMDANRPASSTEYESIQRNVVIGAAPTNSGGRSEQVLQPAGLDPLMQQFAAELVFAQYAVTYFTNSDRARLEVETSRSGVKLRAPARVGPK